MSLIALNRRYKIYRWIQHITFWVSIGIAVVPGIVEAFKIAPFVKGALPKIGLAGYALFLVAVGVLIVLRALGKRFAHKIPWAISAAAASWVLFLVLLSLKSIINEATAIAFAFATGTGAAVILSSVSEIFKVLANITSEEFDRRSKIENG